MRGENRKVAGKVLITRGVTFGAPLLFLLLALPLLVQSASVWGRGGGLRNAPLDTPTNTPTFTASPIPCQAVNWINMVNVTASGNSIQKLTNGGNSWNAGAVSNRAIQSGNGYVQITVDVANTNKIFGLSNGDTNQNYSDVDFGLLMNSSGTLQVIEGGTQMSSLGAYAAGDVLKVSVESGVVKYYQNGALLYTSSQSPTYPLLLDTSIHTSGASITNAYICGNLGSVPSSTPTITYTPTPTFTPACGLSWRVGNTPNIGTLNAVAAVASDDIWAVSSSAQIIHWNGNTWSTITNPNPGIAAFYGLAAISANNIWAVGLYNNNGHDQTLIEHWDGIGWSIVSSPNATSNSNNWLQGVAAISANDVWAVGWAVGPSNSGTLTMHWDGTVWSIVSSPNATGNNILKGVAAVSANDVWAVGYSDSGTLIMHWNGIQWTIDPGATVAGGILYGITATDANNVRAVGYVGSSTLIEYWDGSQWNTDFSPNPGTNYNHLFTISAVSSSDIWAVGEYVDTGSSQHHVLVLHYDGLFWSANNGANIGPDNFLYGVAAIGASNVWVVGWSSSSPSLVEYYREPCGTPTSTRTFTRTPTLTPPNTSTPPCGPAWRVVNNPSTGILVGVAAVAPNDVWAVSTNGDIVHWNGTTWGLSANFGGGRFNAISAISANDIWAVGNPGTIHWNGAQWSLVSNPGTAYLWSVGGVASNDVWATGDGFIHWDGNEWSTVSADTSGTGNKRGLVAISANDVWALGDGSVALHWDGGQWNRVTRPTASEIDGAVGLASNNVWAVGQSGPVAEHWNGAQWTPVSVPSVVAGFNTLRGVTAVSANDVWGVGYYGGGINDQTLIEHWTGSSWNVVPSPNFGSGNSRLWAISASSAQDVWAVGENNGSAAVLRYYDPCGGTGSTFTPTSTVTRTITQTRTPTNTPNVINTPTNTPTSTQTPSLTPTSIPTNTFTNTPTNTLTPSSTPTITPTYTRTNTPTITSSPTRTSTRTPTIDPADVSWDNRFGAAGVNGTVRAIVISGTDVYVGGQFTTAGGVSANNIAKWDGSQWFALGNGANNGVGGDVKALAVSGTSVYVGGYFTTVAGGTVSANRVAKWDSSTNQWFALGNGANNGVDQEVDTVAITGTQVYVGGGFTTAAGGTVSADRVAKWDSSTNQWSALGSGANNGASDTVISIAINGANVYVGGYFTAVAGGTVNASAIARWDSTTNQWSDLAGGVNQEVDAIATSGNDVYVGGSIISAGGGTVSARNIAKWDSSTNQWSALGSGANNGVSGILYSIAISGPSVYVGGFFDRAAGNTVHANNIARWDSSTNQWSALGSGTDDTVVAISITGTEAYVGGIFTIAGGQPSYHFGLWHVPSGSTTNTPIITLTPTNTPTNTVTFTPTPTYTLTRTNTPTNTPTCERIWQVVVAPTAVGANNSELDSISAVSANDMWAGGWYTNTSNMRRTLIEHWTSPGIWNVVSSPNLTGTTHNEVHGVAALSANNVWAVGSSYNGSAYQYQPLIMHYGGQNQWDIQTVTPTPIPGSTGSALTAITVSGLGNIWAVGYYLDGSGAPHPLTYQYDGANWFNKPVTGTLGTLQSVSALSGNDVWAVGSNRVGSFTFMFTLHWNGSTWSNINANAPGTSISEALQGVVAISPNDVWAVGYYIDGSYGSNNTAKTLVEHWNGTQWNLVPSPNVGSSTNPNYLTNIATAGANDLWAVGYHHGGTNGNDTTLVEHWDGSNWSLVNHFIFTSNTRIYSAITVGGITPTVWTVGYQRNTQDLLALSYACQPPAPTPTLTRTNTPTSLPTFTHTSGNTPTNTYTFSPTNTPTRTPTNTPTSTPTFTITNTPSFTRTPSPSNTPTDTPVFSNNGDYSIIHRAQATIVPDAQKTLVPNSRCDECILGLTMPFPYALYGVPYNSATLGDNGELAFGTNGNTFFNSCLDGNGLNSNSNFSNAIFGHWDDLDMRGNLPITDTTYIPGIYTSLSGSTPNRIFNIEWRACLYAGGACGGKVNFEVRLYEGQGRFDVVYGEVTNSAHSATLGVQRSTGNSNLTQFACNGIQSGGGLRPNDTVTPEPPISAGEQVIYYQGPSPTNTPSYTPTFTITPGGPTLTPTFTPTDTPSATPTPLPLCGQPPNYVFVTATATIDQANKTPLPLGHCNDCVARGIGVPFPLRLYGSPAIYNYVDISTNGNIRLTTATATATPTGPTSTSTSTPNPVPTGCPSGDCQSYCLDPSSEANVTLQNAIFAYWDELDMGTDTSCPTCGIYTAVSTDTTGSRIFYVEWRAMNAANHNPVDFEVRFFENRDGFDLVYAQVGADYGSTSGGANASIGVLGSSMLQSTGFLCHTPSLSVGTMASFSLPQSCVTATPTSTPTQPVSIEATYTATSVPVTIPGGGYVESVITVPNGLRPLDAPVITNVDVTGLNISHTVPSSLNAFLISPSGNVVQLFSGICANDAWTTDNTGFTLSSRNGVTATIDSACPPNQGTYRPQSSSLSSFVNQDAMGQWRLQIRVNPAQVVTGTLNGWGLRITTCGGCPASTPTSTPTLTPTYTVTPTDTPTDTPTSTQTLTSTNTPTNTPSPTPAGVIHGHLTWQGVAANNRPLVTGTLTLCVSGTSANFDFAADTSGNFTITTGVPDGIYHWQVKGGRHVGTSSPADGADMVISGGQASQEFGTQKGGNTNTDNIINATDFTALKNQFGQSGIRAADADYNQVVNASDFNILKGNFGQSGHNLSCP